MCGIAGLWADSKVAADIDLGAATQRMTDTLARRGPDDHGLWLDVASGIAFGHRRLSIQDPSPGGRQPMLSATGRYAITFNGEVYNFKAIRQELESAGLATAGFRGSSDTEVMLAAIEAWGLVPAVSRFIGMFAFALWDRAESRLSLVRDRLGVKPLCYAAAPGSVAFASDLRALATLPFVSRTVDPISFRQVISSGCVWGTRSIYESAKKVPPGGIVDFSAHDLATPTIRRYWSVPRAQPGQSPYRNIGEAVEAVDALLRDSVRLRLISDVPVGAFLSGGVDSSCVVAIMSALGHRVRTYSIGFRERDLDESRYSERVAAHLETEHTSLILTPEDALQVLQQMPLIYDEPFADSSQLPTLLVSQLARQTVAVALSGDGGDELFGGYNRYAWADRVFSLIALLPEELRLRGPDLARAGARAADALPSFAKLRLPLTLLGERSEKFARALRAKDPLTLYRILRALDGAESSGLFEGPPVNELSAPPLRSSPAEQFMYWDLCSYLPDDILTKVDRASMAVSLEVREPLLDHRLVELAAGLPFPWKISGGETKRVLRRVTYRYVPKRLLQRPKAGFSVPLNRWLRSQLSSWAEERILSAARSSFFDQKPLLEIWKRHKQGTLQAGPLLWAAIMFETWRERNHGA
jgi:asparagine synthase (glutamine-hydrolysing)